MLENGFNKEIIDFALWNDSIARNKRLRELNPHPVRLSVFNNCCLAKDEATINIVEDDDHVLLSSHLVLLIGDNTMLLPRV